MVKAVVKTGITVTGILGLTGDESIPVMGIGDGTTEVTGNTGLTAGWPGNKPTGGTVDG